MGKKSFKEFIEEKESGHPFISSIEDVLGIDPRDFTNEPLVGSFYSFKNNKNIKNISNIGTYKPIKFIRDKSGKITHALVKQINKKGMNKINYQDAEGEIKKIEPEELEDKVHIVPIEDLDKLMSQDFAPPPQSRMF